MRLFVSICPDRLYFRINSIELGFSLGKPEISRVEGLCGCVIYTFLWFILTKLKGEECLSREKSGETVIVDIT